MAVCILTILRPGVTYARRLFERSELSVSAQLRRQLPRTLGGAEAVNASPAQSKAGCHPYHAIRRTTLPVLFIIVTIRLSLPPRY
jgi:hypothetical protein